MLHYLQIPLGFSTCIINAGILKLWSYKPIPEFPFSVHEEALTVEKVDDLGSLQNVSYQEILERFCYVSKQKIHVLLLVCMAELLWASLVTVEERDCLENELIGMLSDRLIPRFGTKCWESPVCKYPDSASLLPANTCSWQAEDDDG